MNFYVRQIDPIHVPFNSNRLLLLLLLLEETSNEEEFNFSRSNSEAILSLVVMQKAF